MEVLKFSLSGKHAFFKMPEVNTYFYFTYGNIHKVALLGLFGAIVGYQGYAQMKKEDEYPEFYQKLQGIQLAVVPKEGSKGYIMKKIQSFNNSVGYASQEQGGNLIVKQQWLENPWWEIYLKIQDEESEKIKQRLLNHECVYIPYLGSNDHPANILDIELLEAEKAEENVIDQIDSLFPEHAAEPDYEDDEILPFKYAEFLPVGLKKETHMYQLKKFIFTNCPISSHTEPVYRVNGKNILFF